MNRRILRMFEGTFSLDTAHIINMSNLSLRPSLTSVCFLSDYLTFARRVKLSADHILKYFTYLLP